MMLLLQERKLMTAKELSEELEVDQLKYTISPTILNTVKTNPDLATFRRNGISIIYRHKDKVGVFLFDIQISPRDYNEALKIKNFHFN